MRRAKEEGCQKGETVTTKTVLPVFTGIGLFLLSGCASIQSTSISDVARGPGHRIRAEDVSNGILMVMIPELDAAAKLKAQCGGVLTGVQTVTWVRNWVLVQTYHQEASGWCQAQ